MVIRSTSKSVRVRARLLQLFASLERAGATPIANRDLHAVAYLANVLSPLWDVDPVETSVLKDRHGPRSTALEHELDACVGAGLVVVETLQPDPEDAARLSASYRLNGPVAQPVLASINSLPDERVVSAYLNELAFAFAEIAPDLRDDAAVQDAAWSNPAIATGRVVDFGEYFERSASNPTYDAAEAFQRFAPEGLRLTRAEKLVMYVRLLNRRAHG